MTTKDKIHRALLRTSVIDCDILSEYEEDILDRYLSEVDDADEVEGFEAVAVTRIIDIAAGAPMSDEDLGDLAAIETTRIIIAEQIRDGSLREKLRDDGTYCYHAPDRELERVLH
jgi:hypothetical protein